MDIEVKSQKLGIFMEKMVKTKGKDGLITASALIGGPNLWREYKNNDTR